MQGGAGCKHEDENGKSEIEFSSELKRIVWTISETA